MEELNMDITIRIEAPELASAIKALAESIGWYTLSATKPEVAAKFAEPKKDPEPAAIAPEPVEEPSAPPASTITYEQLQAKAAELIRVGKRDAVKAILDTFKVAKISSISETDRAAAYKALEASQ
jgi:hypothetical protein